MVDYTVRPSSEMGFPCFDVQKLEPVDGDCQVLEPTTIYFFWKENEAKEMAAYLRGDLKECDITEPNVLDNI